MRVLQVPGLLSGCSSHSWSRRHSFLHSWATVPRTRCPGLKTLFQGQSRKYLCLCPRFLHTPPCVLALAVPRAPYVPSAWRPFPEADPCLGHSRAGALEPSSACSQLHPAPQEATLSLHCIQSAVSRTLASDVATALSCELSVPAFPWLVGHCTFVAYVYVPSQSRKGFAAA